MTVHTLSRAALRSAFTLAATAALAAAAPAAVAAQTSVGIKGGVALANMWGDAVGNVELRNGLSAGAFLEVAATPSVSFMPEVLFTQKGGVESGLIDAGAGLTLAEGTWQYDYVDVSALLKRTFGGGDTKIGIYAGPQYSILVSAKAVGDGGEIDLTEVAKSNDIGGAAGVTVEFGGGALLDIRYSIGTIAFDEPPLDLLYARQHNVISAMFGIRTGG